MPSHESPRPKNTAAHPEFFGRW